MKSSTKFVFSLLVLALFCQGGGTQVVTKKETDAKEYHYEKRVLAINHLIDKAIHAKEFAESTEKVFIKGLAEVEETEKRHRAVMSKDHRSNYADWHEITKDSSRQSFLLLGEHFERIDALYHLKVAKLEAKYGDYTAAMESLSKAETKALSAFNQADMGKKTMSKAQSAVDQIRTTLSSYNRTP